MKLTVGRAVTADERRDVELALGIDLAGEHGLHARARLRALAIGAERAARRRPASPGPSRVASLCDGSPCGTGVVVVRALQRRPSSTPTRCERRARRRRCACALTDLRRHGAAASEADTPCVICDETSYGSVTCGGFMRRLRRRRLRRRERLRLDGQRLRAAIEAGRDDGDADLVAEVRVDDRAEDDVRVLVRRLLDQADDASLTSCSVRSGPPVMLIRMPVAPSIETSSSSGELIAISAASMRALARPCRCRCP